MRPDEAYGMILNLEHVVVDTRAVQRAAWARVAAAEGLPLPAIEREAMYELRPERAITELLLWTRNWRRAQVRAHGGGWVRGGQGGAFSLACA